MFAFTRKGLAALVVTVAALASAVLAGPPASAEPGTVTCSLGTTVLTFSPPLTNIERTTTVTANRQLGNCVSTFPNAPVVTGTSHWSATFPALCSRPIVGTPLVMTIEWNTGHTSTLDLNVMSVTILGEIHNTWNGSITDGLFDGSTIVWHEVLASDGPLFCFGQGIPSVWGPLTTQITSTA